MQSIDRTLKQIQQWYAHEDLSVDEMDWHPEVEVVIPQPAETVVFAKPWDVRSNLVKGVPSAEPWGLNEGVNERRNSHSSIGKGIW